MKFYIYVLTVIASCFLFINKSYSQCACCAGAGIGSSNGDYNNGILTLNKNKWVAEAYGDYRTIKDGPAPQDEEKILKNMFIASLGLRYGVSKNLTISALTPFVFLHTKAGNDNGLGDLDLMATLKLYNKNNFNIAVQAGVELPTGVKKSISKFENVTLVVGSGSYDPMIGIIVSKSWDKFILQGNGLYKHTTNGFGKNYYGSLSVQNLTVTYKLKTMNNTCKTDSSKNNNSGKYGLSLFAGYYGEWLDKLKEDGVVDENSGHYSGFVTIGTNLSLKKFSFPITLSLPVIANMNGLQNPPGYRLRLGLIRSF